MLVFTIPFKAAIDLDAEIVTTLPNDRQDVKSCAKSVPARIAEVFFLATG